MIYANNINTSGFDANKNIVTIITADKILKLLKLSKENITKQILNQSLILSKKYQFGIYSYILAIKFISFSFVGKPYL